MSDALARAARVLGSDGRPARPAAIRPPFTSPENARPPALSVPLLNERYGSWQRHLIEAHAAHADAVSVAEAYRRKPGT